jgi:tRNA 2-thiouridine synthesizing protein A
MTSLGIDYYRTYHHLFLDFAKTTPVTQAQEQLDACGLKCPEPLMLVRNKVRSMRSGEVLLVRATDPTTERDLKQFCQFLGHEMLDSKQEAGVFEFLIRKAAK